MNRDYTFKELIEMARKVIVAFDRVEKRPWTIETTMIELIKQVGDLAKRIIISRNIISRIAPIIRIIKHLPKILGMNSRTYSIALYGSPNIIRSTSKPLIYAQGEKKCTT